MYFNGQAINNIQYADDTVILADNIDNLSRIMNNILEISNEYGLKINTKKTKFFIVAKKE